MYYNLFIRNSLKIVVYELLKEKLQSSFKELVYSERYGDNRGGYYYEIKSLNFIIEIMDNIGEIADDDYIDYEIMLLITSSDAEKSDDLEYSVKVIEESITGLFEYSIVKY